MFATYHAMMGMVVSKLPGFFPGAMCRVSDRNAIALTIDDGPSPRGTEALLHALEATGLKVTCFLTGSAAEAYPTLVRDIAANGHMLASHGYEHRDFSLASANTVRDDILRSFEAIGERTPWYRPPYGRMNPMHRGIPQMLGTELVLWSRMPREYVRRQSMKHIERRMRSVRGGDILVLHDNERTAGLLPDLVYMLKYIMEEKRLKDTFLMKGQ